MLGKQYTKSRENHYIKNLYDIPSFMTAIKPSGTECFGSKLLPSLGSPEERVSEDSKAKKKCNIIKKMQKV